MQKKIVPYEILIRLNRDGSVAGAHYQEEILMLEGDKIEHANLAHAKPLTAKSAPALKTIMNDAGVKALEQLQEATATIEELRAQLSQAQTDRDAAARELDIVKASAARTIEEHGIALDVQIRESATLRQQAAELRAFAVEKVRELEERDAAISRLTAVTNEQTAVVAQLAGQLKQSAPQKSSFARPPRVRAHAQR